ncbi:MAG: hypothetical protein HY302_10295 [Opitutae bacterium]|nr:hypothetical protein [Opitutae bacterium]
MWFTEIARAENPGREEMHGFVVGVERFLAFVLESEKDFGFLWADDPELHGLAWETFKLDVAGAGGTVHQAIDESLSARQVELHGLTGRALRFKLRVLDAIARRWEKFRGQLRVREWLKQMFEAIDAILDSLIDAAGGAGGLIKEFKDALGALAATG